MMYFDRHIPAYLSLFWRVLISTRSSHLENPSQNINKTCLSSKSGQTTAPAWGENIILASHELCAHVISKIRHCLCFGAWVCICFKRLPAWESPTALRMTSFEFARGNSTFIGGNSSNRARVKPSTAKWFHLVPLEYYLTVTEMEIWPIKVYSFGILMIIII